MSAAATPTFITAPARVLSCLVAAIQDARTDLVRKGRSRPTFEQILRHDTVQDYAEEQHWNEATTRELVLSLFWALDMPVQGDGQ